ncbi:MAG: Holliday junction resolvase RuvX [Candidatus Moranbacteria bacterium]|nr:Holliday junction resolvase RuvX [Candidatus Moranbacteria bacterium]
MTRYFLGLDWGKAKVGVALADDETRMAFAHSIIRNDGQLFDALKKIVQENDVETVVVGVPSSFAHAQGVGDAARTFGERVAKECGVKVEFFQEMFTTKMAQSNLLQSGKERSLDDQEAARLILQEWLDKA